ncbi:MAG: aldo/keto reductase [Roseobacter sp.]
MKKRQLLSTGQTVSEIGLGCLSFAGFYGPSSKQEAFNTLAKAADLGVDLLDTANVYGQGLSESLIGEFIRQTKAEFTVASKAGIWRDANGNGRGFNNKAKYLRQELEGSLTRLGVEQIDLYYIHRRDPDVEIEEVMKTLLTFKAEGKIAGIGFSEISPASLRRAAAVGPVDAVQSEYSLWTRQPELGMLTACQDLKVAMVPYSPLGRGIFAQTPPDPATFASIDFRLGNPRFLPPNYAYNLEYVEKLSALAQDLGTTVPTLALAWCLAQGPHLIPIPGTRSAKHLEECVRASDFEMTPDIRSAIENILPCGWAHGDRYSAQQWNGPEGYC